VVAVVSRPPTNYFDLNSSREAVVPDWLVQCSQKAEYTEVIKERDGFIGKRWKFTLINGECFDGGFLYEDSKKRIAHMGREDFNKWRWDK